MFMVFRPSGRTSAKLGAVWTLASCCASALPEPRLGRSWKGGQRVKPFVMMFHAVMAIQTWSHCSASKISFHAFSLIVVTEICPIGTKARRKEEEIIQIFQWERGRSAFIQNSRGGVRRFHLGSLLYYYYAVSTFFLFLFLFHFFPKRLYTQQESGSTVPLCSKKRAEGSDVIAVTFQRPDSTRRALRRDGMKPAYFFALAFFSGYVRKKCGTRARNLNSSKLLLGEKKNSRYT